MSSEKPSAPEGSPRTDGLLGQLSPEESAEAQKILSIIDALEDPLIGRFPAKAAAGVEDHKDRFRNVFLEELKAATHESKYFVENDPLFFHFAVLFLAKWREPRALPGMVAWLNLPEELHMEHSPELVIGGIARYLAAASGGDAKALMAIVEDAENSEFVRGYAVSALVTLVAWGEFDSAKLDDFLCDRAGTLGETDAVLWGTLAFASSDLGLPRLRPLVLEAFEKDWIADEVITRAQYEDEYQYGRESPLEESEAPRVTKIATECADWEIYSGPYIRPEKVGRNDPCPCGSNKKFKKCCGKNA